MKGFMVLFGLLLPIPGVTRGAELSTAGFRKLNQVDQIIPRMSMMSGRSESVAWGHVRLQILLVDDLVADVLILRSDLASEAVTKKLAHEPACKPEPSLRSACTIRKSHFNAMACGSGMIIWRENEVLDDHPDQDCALLKEQQRFMK